MRKRTTKKTKQPEKKAPKTRGKVKKTKSFSTRSVATNKKAHWDAYKDLQKRVDLAWDKLRTDVKKKASPHILIEDRDQLLLLLGECNYMARECMHYESPYMK